VYKAIRSGSSKSACVLVGVYGDQARLPRGLDCTSVQRTSLQRLIKTPGFRGDAGETLIGADKVAVVGLGARDDLTADGLRTIGARALRQLDRAGISAVSLAVHAAVPAKVASADMVGRCLAEGMSLANWKVDFFDGAAAQDRDKHAALSLTSDDAEVRRGIRKGLILGEATNEARRCAATPPNICNPTWMAGTARAMARKLGIACRVITYKQAQELGMGGIVNVGKASTSKPCLIILDYKPTGRGAEQPLVLVGKTITYDTGGYSLKISNGMKGMKYDKNGGMAVLGAMHAIASLKLKRRVVALLPAAENMVAGDAYRPDDIITMYNGVTVEVTNTDAEGRLVLADALAYACRKLKPRAIVDMATLTGGVVVALGYWSAGLFCNDDKLRGAVETASDVTGERTWQLPLWDDHKSFMRSKHADIWNSGPKRDGHAIQGAAFLSYFVDEDVPWAHIDIAGVSDVSSDTDLYCTGPNGYGVRLLVEIAEHS
jgi:leucyl aminopeptidase